MVDEFEKKFEAVNDLCREIALVEHENWFVLEQARKVSDQIAKIRAKHEKSFGGAIASDALLRKKTDEFRHSLEARSRGVMNSQGRPTLRLTGPIKIQVLKAMLLDFNASHKEHVTLEDIESWCSRERRSGRAEVLSELGIGSVSIPSTQFFQTTINGNPVRLFPSEAYRTQKPPFPAQFVVKPWLTWLQREERRLLRGEQTPADKSSARSRTRRSR